LFSYADQRDTIAIGSFHATSKGITLVSLAGNSGPMFLKPVQIQHHGSLQLQPLQ